MLHHNAMSSDVSYGKYNGYSDFLHHDESSVECLNRVVLEMTGLTVRKARFRGSIHWPNFRQRQLPLFGQVFVVEEYEGLPREFNALGHNRWITLSELLRGDAPIWDGDKHFLPLVFDRDPVPFHGYMPYERGVPRNWFYQRA
jgi:8-oxo-dGTP diphosphatase